VITKTFLDNYVVWIISFCIRMLVQGPRIYFSYRDYLKLPYIFCPNPLLHDCVPFTAAPLAASEFEETNKKIEARFFFPWLMGINPRLKVHNQPSRILF